jgi:hypothetical protein
MLKIVCVLCPYTLIITKTDCPFVAALVSIVVPGDRCDVVRSGRKGHEVHKGRAENTTDQTNGFGLYPDSHTKLLKLYSGKTQILKLKKEAIIKFLI